MYTDLVSFLYCLLLFCFMIIITGTASLQSQLITTSQSQLITTSSNQFHAVTTNVANSEEIPWPGAVRVLFRESVPTI